MFSRICILAGCCVMSLFAAVDTPVAPDRQNWNSKAAAAYMDGRMNWWMSWTGSARDHETFCVSCHTVLPYTLGRPALRTALGEQAPSPVEHKIIDNVTKRVRLWQDVKPFYADSKIGDPKTAESRGTESILNAMVLMRFDMPAGRLGPDARLAFENMWAEQLHTGPARGSWNWLQFHNAPFEGDSQYYGATLAAIAVAMAPGNYRSTPEIQDGLRELTGYLVRERESQKLIDRVLLVWAATKIPGLLTPEQQKATLDEALSKQQADGGFSLSSFVGAWKRRDNTPLDPKSDGYATGVVTFVLQQTGVARDQPQLQRGLAWLAQNQEKSDGRWAAYSLNKQRELESTAGRFMSDAATGYAVLALNPAN
jgi:squalene-hopene/tetraprenyl-beta-curcumene cyclase